MHCPGHATRDPDQYRHGQVLPVAVGSLANDVCCRSQHQHSSSSMCPIAMVGMREQNIGKFVEVPSVSMRTQTGLALEGAEDGGLPEFGGRCQEDHQKPLQGNPAAAGLHV